MISQDMEYRFKHSLVVMGHLAQGTARTPPPEDAPPLEYIDRSLCIMGRTFDIYDQKIQGEFLAQREFIASEFRAVEKRFQDVDKRIDEKFQEADKSVDKKFFDFDAKMEKRFAAIDERFAQVDRRFEELEAKMDRKFEETDRRFDRLEAIVQGLQVQFDNNTAMRKNGRIRRIHQPILHVKVLKPTAVPGQFEWTSHPQVPKHMKGVYYLGQRAKGIFEPTWSGKSYEEKWIAKQKAQETINELARFYDVELWSDEYSESDATEVRLQESSVDEFMETLLAEWGIEWSKVMKMAERLLQPQLAEAGVKRSGGASSQEEKRVRRHVDDDSG